MTTDISKPPPIPVHNLVPFANINLLLTDLHNWLLNKLSDRPIALLWECDNFSSLHNLPTKSARAFTTLFVEACDNCFQHSDASAVEIQCVELTLNRRRGLALSISDNGTGYATQNIKRNVGLKSMKHQASVLGAELIILSDQSGTQIKVWLPANPKTTSEVR